MLWPSLLVRIVLCAVLLVIVGAAVPAMAWEGVVVRVVDGDTVVVTPRSAPDTDITIRLYGIDAPELQQPGGQQSLAALRALVQTGDRVEIIGLSTDRYHRSVALLTREKRTLNYEMVRRGEAWVYSRYCRTSFCRTWRKAEKLARKEGIGLWAQPDPTPPWQWRKQNEKTPPEEQ